MHYPVFGSLQCLAAYSRIKRIEQICHITFALSSLAHTCLSLLRPQQRKVLSSPQYRKERARQTCRQIVHK
uniref:Uncharacterized protein n=1 Tax=Physcomitrium patens TaxID=3218 RepID=A0A2K1KUV9_PHYPA|nr:hypothetical protein PHYPA_004520 [Physcomitrium patens]